jgi:hypothetical protein
MTPWRRYLTAVLAPLVLAVLVPWLGVHPFGAPVRAVAAVRDDRPPVPGQATLPPGEIVVRGRIYYTDRLGDRNHAAAGLRIEIWDQDSDFSSTGEKLGEVVTDASGRFESLPISNVDPDGPTGAHEGTQDVFLKLYTDNGRVRLRDAGNRGPFDWMSYEIDPRAGAVLQNVADGVVGFPTLYIVEGTPDVEAMWTFVNLSEAWQYLQTHTGTDPGEITAYWSAGSQDGPRYDPETHALYFRDEDAAFADLVIQYATYALLHNIYGTLPDAWLPCLSNVPADPRRETDPACALLHGLATFLPLAVQADPEFETPSLAAIDLDAAHAGMVGWAAGDRVPARIAGAFWDLHEGDQTEDGYDQFNATFEAIWDVFAQRRPDTMAAWWAGWRALGKNGCGAVGSLYQNTIDYNTPPRIQQVPDVEIAEDETAIVDLKNYVDDAECDRNMMAFSLIDAGVPEAGVKLLPTNVISITPQAEWFGHTTVVVGVSDGLVTSRMTFGVTVRSINDCPRISPRVPDPAPVSFVDPIILELEAHGKDAEDPPSALTWDVEIDARYAADITVLGRGTRQLIFILQADVATGYGALVTMVVRDTDGCAARQALALYWTAEDNTPPHIRSERFTREYRAPVNTTIRVDLTGVAADDEDSDDSLEWFVLNPAELNAQVRKTARQVIDFEPQISFVGSRVAQLEVQDTGAARVTAAITLTWTSRDDLVNQPPSILRQKLLGRTVGVNAEACYELTDKAVDPDHNQFSLRWYAEPADPRDLFVGAQGTRRLCLASRPNFEGCLFATFIVRDPLDAEDRHEVQTCWRQMALYLPTVSGARR